MRLFVDVLVIFNLAQWVFVDVNVFYSMISHEHLQDYQHMENKQTETRFAFNTGRNELLVDPALNSAAY